MAITPEQVATRATLDPARRGAGSGLDHVLADAFDHMIEEALLRGDRPVRVHERFGPDGSMYLPPTVLAELERRYQAAGWKTKLEGTVLTIDLP